MTHPPRLLLALTLVLSHAHTSARAADPGDWFDDHAEEFVRLYQHFHSHPELSNDEEQTAARVALELKALGLDVTAGVGKHGVVGVLKNGDGPTVLWRCDLDALPVTENTGLPFASKVRTAGDDGREVGVMHACGHDIHITNLIASARYMSAHKPDWRGTLVFIGQPAEERTLGAKQMLDDGLFTRFPRPDFCLALHVDARLPAGSVGFRAGYALANVDACDITVRGRGGHGSAPENCIDPIVQAAELVVALQTIVSREISPLEPAVVTVGSIHGGTKHNIISDSCHLQITLRSYTDEVRARLKSAVERKAKAIAASYGAPEPTVKFSQGTPAVINDEALVNRVVPEFVSVLGDDRVIGVDRVMGAEDFSLYGRAGVPSFMFRLGSLAPERLKQFESEGRTPPSLHSAEYYPEPRETLRTGLATTVAALNALLDQP
jgi:amidohydrolase